MPRMPRVCPRRLSAAAVALLALATVPTAGSDTLTVTDCGDTLPGGTAGQLRRLITEAGAGDTIQVPACVIFLDGDPGDNANATGDLDLAKDVTIEGAGAGTVIKRGTNFIDRGFHVQPGVTATLRNLGIDGLQWVVDGGAILNEGALTLTSVVVSNNVGSEGGGIENAAGAQLSVADCVIRNNTGNAGGGGIANRGTAVVVRTSILENHGTSGGGGILNFGTLTVVDSTLAANDVLYAGGGLANRGTGVAIVTGTTISGNATSSGGGGIENTATLQVTNSTVSGNSVTGGGKGGGIENTWNGAIPTMTLTRVTVAGNSASGGGNALSSTGGPTSGTIEGSILSGSCYAGDANSSAGHNIDAAGFCFYPPDATDLVGVADVKLGPLADNGGLTLTHMPDADSPAVDAGGATCATAADQRGLPRPQGAACDIGAVERTEDVIFQDGFESGDLTAWSGSVSVGGGTLSVTPGAALAGSGFGLQATVNGAGGMFVQDDSPAGEAVYRARFYFDPSQFDPGQASGHFRARVFLMFDEAGSRRLSALVLKRQGDAFSLMQRCRRDDNTQADTGFFPLTPGAHWVMVETAPASTASSSDGRCALTVDGTTLATLSAVQNSLGAVGTVRLGAMSVKAGATGTLRLDEFVSRRRGAIPPVP
jgi:hypothetical protein